MPTRSSAASTRKRPSRPPGVVLVIDHRSCPDIAYGQAGQGFPEPSPYDYRMFSRTVRHMGDRVAAVVAEDEAAARGALVLIRVEYDVITPVLSIDDARSGRLAAVHADHLDSIVYQLSIGADAGKNLAGRRFRRHGRRGGRAEKRGRRGRAHIFDEPGSSARRSSPTSSTRSMDGDRLIVHASTQVPWHLRRILARVLGMPENRIRVIKERVGGGYGSKQDILLEEVAPRTRPVRTGRPVLYKFTREEEFIGATTRHPVPRSR